MPIPNDSDFTGASVTEGAFKTALTTLLANLRGLLGTTGLAVDARAALGLGGTPIAYNARGAWATSTVYAVNDTVTQSGVVYACQVAHTAGTFATDLAAAKWYVLQGVTSASLSASGGAGLVGFLSSISYAAGTVGDWIKRRFLASPYASDYADLATAAASGVSSLKIDPGTYAVTANLSFPMPVEILPGALLNVSASCVVAFNAGFSAGVYKCWTLGAGSSVTFNWRYTNVGFPEWWGAKSDLSADAAPAINACVVALQITQLHAGDYLANSPLLVQLDHRCLFGIGAKYNDVANTQTRVLTSDGSQVSLVVGPWSFPGSINTLQKNNVVKDIYFNRNVSGPVISSNCVGVDVRYTLFAHIINVKVAESMLGFRSYGNVSGKFDDCESVRSTAGTGAGTDFWVGFQFDGTASIGAAGGNASVYSNRCAASCNYAALQTSNSYGFQLSHSFTDLFLSWPETTNTNIGIFVQGDNTTGNTANNTDLHIDHPILDQFHNSGIYITVVNEAGSIDISHPYLGPASGARCCLWFNNNWASCTVTGGQWVMGGAPGCQAVIIDTTTGVQLLGGQILEHGNTYPVVGMSTASNCRIQPTIKNRSVTAGAAVQLANTCTANVIDPTVMGKVSAFTFGVQVVGTGDARNEYRMGGIDSACISGGSANKLVRNGAQVTTVGTTGTNYASGVMA